MRKRNDRDRLAAIQRDPLPGAARRRRLTVWTVLAVCLVGLLAGAGWISLREWSAPHTRTSPVDVAGARQALRHYYDLINAHQDVEGMWEQQPGGDMLPPPAWAAGAERDPRLPPPFYDSPGAPYGLQITSSRVHANGEVEIVSDINSSEQINAPGASFHAVIYSWQGYYLMDYVDGTWKIAHSLVLAAGQVEE